MANGRLATLGMKDNILTIVTLSGKKSFPHFKKKIWLRKVKRFVYDHATRQRWNSKIQIEICLRKSLLHQ